MDMLRNAGKCLFFTKCGCIPGSPTEKIFKRCFIVHSEGSITTWDYVKDKLGFQKKNSKRGVRERIGSNYTEAEPIPIPVHSNSRDEMWTPGYRGRTENKRF